MNIKETAEKYYQEWRKYGTPNDLTLFFERVVTKERQRRLPSKEEFIKYYKNIISRSADSFANDANKFSDWLLSYDSENHIVEDNEKVVNQPINRNELAEKIMIESASLFFTHEDCILNEFVHDSFRLADEFIKQAKG